MQYFLLGLVVLLLALMASNKFVAANPASMARHLRTGGGVLALGVGGILAYRGMAPYAMWLAALGAWMLFGQRLPRGWPGGAARTDDSRVSRVTTDFLEVELEHDSGAMRGRVIKGFFRGRDLESMRPVEVAHLWSDCQFEDPQSAQILEAYLDRIHPTWRDDMARGDRSNGADDGARDTAGRRVMSLEEARDILGVTVDASEDDIRAAHKRLMLKLHPDRGGSHTLAAKVNEAKDVLLAARRMR